MTDLEKYELIDKFLDEHIRPALAGDGGGIELELVKVLVHLLLVQHLME